MTTDSKKTDEKKASKKKKKLSSRQLLRLSVAVGWLLICALAALAACFAVIAELGVTAGLIVASLVALLLPGALWFWLARTLKRRKSSAKRRRWLSLGAMNLLHIALIVLIIWLAFTPEQIVGTCIDAFAAEPTAEPTEPAPAPTKAPAAPDAGASAKKSQ